MYLLNGKKINIDAAMTLPDPDTGEDTQYPVGWFRDQAARLAHGITEAPDPVRPDERFFFVTENADGTLNSTAKDLTPIKDQYKTMIDQACGAKRATAVSQSAYIEEEYRRAYEDALAYKGGVYNGGAPASVQSWATVAGLTAKQAADDIILTRDGYMALLDAVRDIRLTGKAMIDAATTPADILATIDFINASLDALP